ncbi:hypothetical protein BM1_07996 [Bipolaris maydis]|nr:hypothetical protein BM1_07996 [Bipolaris maydis]
MHRSKTRRSKPPAARQSYRLAIQLQAFQQSKPVFTISLSTYVVWLAAQCVFQRPFSATCSVVFIGLPDESRKVIFDHKYDSTYESCSAEWHP